MRPMPELCLPVLYHLVKKVFPHEREHEHEWKQAGIPLTSLWSSTTA
jgi:hypothetical protein